MYRIMLVDDEIFIVDGISNFLQTKFPDVLDVVKAYSAEEALTLIHKTRIDIVMSDIQMPGMDGFMLYDRIMEYWPNCRFVFLTGYASFDYVYRVLQKGCTRFLLKSSGYEAIGSVLQDILAELKQETLRTPAKARVPDQRKLADFLNGGAPAPSMPAGLRSDLPFSLVMAVSDNTFSPEATRVLEDVSANYFRHMIDACSLSMGHGKIAWLVQAAEKEPDLIHWKRHARFLNGMTEALQTTALDRTGAEFSFAVMPGPLLLEELPWAVRLLRYQLEEIPKSAERMRLLHFEQPSAMFDMPAEQHNSLVRLICAMYTMNCDELQRAFQPIAEQHHHAGPTLRAALWDALTQLYQTFLHHLDNQPAPAPPATLPMMQSALMSKMCAASDAPYQEQLIQQIHSYINRHLSEPLILSDIADHVHMNPSYLSRLYKKITDINLFDYITEIRIRYAKELLKSPETRIARIATDAGFNSVGYFSNVFKKKEGVTPQEYRRILRGEGGD